MRHDEVDAILAAKEREAGQRGVRRMHTHPCQAGCHVPEWCEDRRCPYPPDDRSLACTRISYRLLGVKRANYSKERQREMNTEPGGHHA